MAWARATIEIKPATVGTGVKASLRKGRSAHAKMSISVTGSTMRGFGWKSGDGIEVMIGEAEHHGLIRIRKNASVAQTKVVEKTAVRGASYLQVNLGHQPSFVNRSESAQWCQWEEVDGWVEIVLPKWADETSPKRRSPAEGLMPPSGGSSGGKPKAAAVTASLMGDPPRGRREMLAQIGKVKP